MDAVTIGNNASAPIQNSVAIGTNSQTYNPVAFGQMDINGTTHVFAGANPNSTVSFGSKVSETYSHLDNYNRQLQNVAAGRIEADSLDAVNGSQLYAAIDEINANGNNINTLKARTDSHDQRLDYLQSNVNVLSTRVDTIDTIDTRVNRLGASSAALSGLHPLDFNRNDKASYAVSYGHYKNANAVALGAFYRPNERVMIGLGASLGAENQYTANIAFKFGKGSDYLAEAKSKDARIERLEAMVNQLMAEREAK